MIFPHRVSYFLCGFVEKSSVLDPFWMWDGEGIEIELHLNQKISFLSLISFPVFSSFKKQPQ